LGGEEFFFSEKPIFFRAKNLSVYTKTLRPDLCFLLL
jgi:hypothetical protein